MISYPASQIVVNGKAWGMPREALKSARTLLPQ